jgi:phenylacetate-CoA ligase
MGRQHESLPILIQYVRDRSPFYRDLYKNLPGSATLEELPILDQNAFWDANTYSSNQLLTGPIYDGIILRSGGTTGKPKFSVFTRDEWNEFTAIFAKKLAYCGLSDGDRVANLFYAGELYGSFIFTHKVLEECPLRLLQLPITGVSPLEETVKLIIEYEATVLAALPTTLMSLVEKMGPQLYGKTKVRKILFAGEPMQKDLRERMNQAFPGVNICSIGYASNDAGLLGYVDVSCGPNEFRCFDGHAIYEIFDEATNRPITEENVEGRAVVTAQKRSLMPVLRYPVGDRAMWLEPPGSPNRKYFLLGRSEEAARIASLSLGYEEVQAYLDFVITSAGPFQFQIIMEHRDERDSLAIRISCRLTPDQRIALEPRIIASIYSGKPILEIWVAQKKVHPLRVEWAEPGMLEKNSRSGKLRRIIDLRGR